MSSHFAKFERVLSLQKQVQEFFNYLDLMNGNYRTGNVLITMGEDFHYQDAHKWYRNLDKLIL